MKSRYISTAYGLMTSIQNCGLALAPLFVMRLVPKSPSQRDARERYTKIETFFCLCAFGALCCTVALYYVDARLGGDLCASPADEALAIRPSPRLNPLNPRLTPFLGHAESAGGVSADARRAMAPKTPHAIRQQYFRKLKIHSQR